MEQSESKFSLDGLDRIILNGIKSYLNNISPKNRLAADSYQLGSKPSIKFWLGDLS